MRRLIVLLLLAALPGCRDEPVPEAALPGRLRVGSDSAGVLLDQPARAMACARDTTTAIVAVGPDWAAAISMRVMAGGGERRLAVAATIAQPGSAVVALRSLGDSLFSWISTGGTVRVTMGDSLRGSFEAIVARDSATMRVSGEFASPEIVEGCP